MQIAPKLVVPILSVMKNHTDRIDCTGTKYDQVEYRGLALW